MEDRVVHLSDREITVIMDGLRGYCYSKYHPEEDKKVARASLLKLYDIYHREKKNEIK